jgi:hypothetical protein
MKVPSMIETKVTNSLKGSVLDLIRKDYQFIAGEKIQDQYFANFHTYFFQSRPTETFI